MMYSIVEFKMKVLEELPNRRIFVTAASLDCKMLQLILFILFKGSIFQLQIATFFVSHSFFISNTFISDPRLKLAKNQANAKQHPEA